MKILIEKYPKGSLPNQQTPGRYIDETLYENIKILAKAIIKDMTFLVILTSSTLEVGTGKSVFSQQFGEAYLSLVKEKHKIENELTMQNIVFSPEDLIERSFEVPRYSVIILDEWEDAHYWSQLGISLRQFFRKCRQLNLLMICIIPNYFQLPMSYAISRSICLIDVKFGEGFERGFFKFYNFQTKRLLYLKGRKTMDYNVVRPNFSGRFADGWVVDKDEYHRMKYLDSLKYDKENKKKISEKEITMKIFDKVKKNLTEVPLYRLAEAFEITRQTAYNWQKELENQSKMSNDNTYINYLNLRDDNQKPAPEKKPNHSIK